MSRGSAARQPVNFTKSDDVDEMIHNDFIIQFDGTLTKPLYVRPMLQKAR